MNGTEIERDRGKDKNDREREKKRKRKRERGIEREQVAQGQYVVSNTRCPALSDCELE